MRDENGLPFLDRDPDMFKIVLGYLRRGTRLVGLPQDLYVSVQLFDSRSSTLLLLRPLSSIPVCFALHPCFFLSAIYDATRANGRLLIEELKVEADYYGLAGVVD